MNELGKSLSALVDALTSWVKPKPKKDVKNDHFASRNFERDLIHPKGEDGWVDITDFSRGQLKNYFKGDRK